LFASVLSTGQVSLVGSQVAGRLFCNADDCGCGVGVSDDGVNSFLLSTISFFMLSDYFGFMPSLVSVSSFDWELSLLSPVSSFGFESLFDLS
jgi:hypothetical protein